MSKFKSVVTTLGQARIAAAIESGEDVNITHMAVGDGNGSPTEPSVDQTVLAHETYRLKLNSIKVDNKHANWIIAEAIIPASVGGFWMREMGLFSEQGELIAVSNMADSYKPTLEEGSGRTQTLRMVMTVMDTEAVSLTIDDTLIIATEEYVNNLLAEHEASRRHPDATLTEKGFVQLSSTINSDSEVLAATPKAVKTANDNANSRLPSGGTAVASAKLETPRKIAGVAFDGTKDIAITSGDVGAVHQGGGTGMTNNVVHIGWSTNAKLLAQVDNTPMGEIYCEYNKPTAQDVGALPVTGGNVGYVNNAAHYGIKSGMWEGAGGFNAQYTNNAAPFVIPRGLLSPAGNSLYFPIVKGTIQTENYGFDTTVSFGALTSGNDDFAKAVIHVIGDNGTQGVWSFNPNDGLFSSPGNIFSGKDVLAANAVYESSGGVRVYSPNNKPTPADINCIQRDVCDAAGFEAGNVNVPYMRHVWSGQTIYLASNSWVRQNFVQSISRGAQSSMVMDGGMVEAPAGCVLTGGNGNEGNQVGYALYRPLQMLRNGTWVTIEG